MYDCNVLFLTERTFVLVASCIISNSGVVSMQSPSGFQDMSGASRWTGLRSWVSCIGGRSCCKKIKCIIAMHYQGNKFEYHSRKV